MSSTDEDEEMTNNNWPETSRARCKTLAHNRKGVPEIKTGAIQKRKTLPNGHDPGEGTSRASRVNGKANERLPTLGSLSNDYSGSSSETEDDYCVYKYKGNGVDALPMEELNLRDRQRPRPGSPEADYLEMDFDPGASNGQDCSDDSDCCDMGESCESGKSDAEIEEDIASRPPTPSVDPHPHPPPTVETTYQPSPSNDNALPLTLDWIPVVTPTKKLDFMNQDVQFEPGVKARIWTDKEAVEKQITCSSSPSTGASAVINTLLSFSIEFNRAEVIEKLDVNTTTNHESLPDYFFMRSTSGRRHEDLIRIIKEASNDQLMCRFFPTYPRRRLDLSAFLFYWIRKGAVPIVTFNPQRNSNKSNDPNIGVWHHRMVWSVGESEVYLSDPLQCVSASTMYEQLSTQSTLLIDKDDVLSKWKSDTDLSPLAKQENYTWKHHNVLGQVVNLIREFMSGRGGGIVQHIEIPANFLCGITLVISQDSPHVIELVHTPDVPFSSISGVQ